MKTKTLLTCLLALCLSILQINAQSWISGTNKLYVNPDTIKVGIGITNPSERLHINKGALKIGNSSSAADRSINMLKIGDGNYVQIGEWESDDMLSFKANKYNFTNGNIGLGVSNPQYKLDINGKIFLHNYEYVNDWNQCYLLWESHKLILGQPTGTYSHTLVEIKPGGSSQGEEFSRLSLYHAYDGNNKVEKVRIDTHHNSWINSNANFGIGTDNPTCKLDVRGTLRANEIYVNQVTGADFVFDETYQLRSLSEVQAYIQQNHHLPEIPSASEMKENGVNMNELQIQLLQKIEELTLYIIQQELRLKELECKRK